MTKNITPQYRSFGAHRCVMRIAGGGGTAVVRSAELRHSIASRDQRRLIMRSESCNGNWFRSDNSFGYRRCDGVAEQCS